MVTEKELREHAKKYRLWIHPQREKKLGYVIKTINEDFNGGCMCAKERPKCPCPESVSECLESERGACKCTLFVGGGYFERYPDMKPKDLKKGDTGHYIG